ncbi:hypothetical protein D3C81_1543420 [compost metagenome]
MVGAAVEVLLPGPVVLEGYELVEVGAAVDHALGVDGDAGAFAFQFGQAFGDVELVEGGLGAGHGGGVVGGHGAGVVHGGLGGVVELVRGGAGGSLGRGRLGYGFFFGIEFIPAQHDGSPAWLSGPTLIGLYG